MYFCYIVLNHRCHTIFDVSLYNSHAHVLRNQEFVASALIMRSSACKYVLDKVSKFEKKYAKPVQKIIEIEEDDFLSSKDNSYLEHAKDKIKINKKNSASCSHVSQDMFSKRLDELDPLECGTIAVSDVKSISNPFKDICESSKEDRINVKQRISHIGNRDENRYENYNYNKKIDTHFSSDRDGSVLAEDLNDNRSFGDINELISYKLDKDSFICTEDSLKSLISIEKKIEGNELETPFKINNQEENVKKGCLHVNLNLKLYEDPDEISDTSSKSIASLSLKNSVSSQNVPIHVFTFEDLIGAEELKSVSEELKGSIEEKCQVNVQPPRTVDNSTRSSLIIDDDLHLDSKHDGDIHETSLNSADLEEIVANVGESSIEEDIEEVIESSDEANNESIEQIHSSSENVMLSPEIEVLEFSGSGNRSDIRLRKIESDVIHQEVENDDKQLLKYNPKEFCEIKRHSEHDSTLDKHNRLRKKDGKHFEYAKKKRIREKYLVNEWKLLQRSKNILQDELHNVSTQTEKYLAESYDFEKRMEIIMKTSFNSMNEVNNLSPEVNNVLSGQTSHSVSAMSPLERGFHCALKQQVELTKHFVCAEYNMYTVCMAAIKEMSSTYKPAKLHHNKKMNSKLSSKKAQR